MEIQELDSNCLPSGKAKSMRAGLHPVPRKAVPLAAIARDPGPNHPTSCREISDGLTLLPLRDSLLVDPVALSEGFMGLVIVRVVPHSATRAH
jgi:hypothetical protein